MLLAQLRNPEYTTDQSLSFILAGLTFVAVFMVGMELGQKLEDFAKRKRPPRKSTQFLDELVYLEKPPAWRSAVATARMSFTAASTIPWFFGVLWKVNPGAYADWANTAMAVGAVLLAASIALAPLGDSDD